MTPALIDKAQRMYDNRQFTMAEVAASRGVTPNGFPGHHRSTPDPLPLVLKGRYCVCGTPAGRDSCAGGMRGSPPLRDRGSHDQ
jgi:hypothetical protein